MEGNAMQYDLELEFFDGRQFKSCRRDIAATGTIHDAVRAAAALFKDAAEQSMIPFVCRVVERDSGQLVAVVGAERGTGGVLTTMHMDYRGMQ
jgi:hypothetical protein